MTTSPALRWIRLVLPVALLASIVAVAGGTPGTSTSSASAQTSCRAWLDAAGNPQVDCSESYPGGGGPEGDGGNGSGGTGERPRCYWAALDLDAQDQETIDRVLEEQDDPPEDGAQWWVLWCGDEPCPLYGSLDGYERCGEYGEYGGRVFWAETDPVPPDTPAEMYLLTELWARVSGNLVEPELGLDPAASDPAIVTIPTFVEVENWADDWEGSEQECIATPDGELCVELTWEASLWYDPGEPGADRVDCVDPPGTRFDPAGPEPRQQAAEGSCTYEYIQHTSGDGAYQATVGVTYDFTWTASSGWTGVFDPIERSTSFSRTVDEVQAIVTDTGLGD